MKEFPRYPVEVEIQTPDHELLLRGPDARGFSRLVGRQIPTETVPAVPSASVCLRLRDADGELRERHYTLLGERALRNDDGTAWEVSPRLVRLVLSGEPAAR